MKIILLLYFLKASHSAFAFWPPAYKIHLNHSETFIISDVFDEDDDEDFSEDDEELIKPDDLENYDLESDSAKYYRIHQFAMKRNRREEKSSTFAAVEAKPNEAPFEEENEAEFAGFVNNKSEIIQDENSVVYLNEMNKGDVLKRIKEMRMQRLRAKQSQLHPADYDYTKLKGEYDKEIQREKKAKDVLKYVDVPEKEGFKDSVKNIVTFKKAKNCTKEEMKGIGMAAVGCYLQDMRDTKAWKKDRKTVMHRMKRFVFIWLFLYAVVASVLWCTKGWCCCCCRCKFCRPEETIEECKIFITDNPVGVLHIGDQRVTYKPSIAEEYFQKRLEHAIMKL